MTKLNYNRKPRAIGGVDISGGRGRKPSKKVTKSQEKVLKSLGIDVDKNMNSSTASKLITSRIKSTKRYKSKVNAANGSKILQKHTPFSENWFYRELKNLQFPILKTEYESINYGLGIRNVHYDTYIPDIINNIDKFIIEIDDSSHDAKIEYDKNRTRYFEKRGFSVFRIKFNSLRSLRSTMKTLITKKLLESENISDTDKKRLLDWIKKINNFI